MRSRSLLPWLVSRLPPFVGSFSTHLSVSSVCRHFRATEPEPARQWEGLVPLFLRTEIQVDKFRILKIQLSLHPLMDNEKLKFVWGCSWGEIPGGRLETPLEIGIQDLLWQPYFHGRHERDRQCGKRLPLVMDILSDTRLIWSRKRQWNIHSSSKYIFFQIIIEIYQN